MLRNFIIPLSTLLISYYSCLGQKSHNYIDYFNSINSIELLVRERQYEQAILAYEDLRIDFPAFFAKDLHNLSICYLKTNQPDSAVSLARQLVLQGRKLHDFGRYSEYNNITSMDCWSIFVDEYPILHKRYQLGIDRKFEKMINDFIISDQKYQEISNEKRDSVYYWQGLELFHYILRNGFPNIFRDENTNGVLLAGMLRHFFYQYNSDGENGKTAKNRIPSWQESNIPLDQVLLTALKDGKLTPALYEKILYTGDQSPYGFVRIQFNFLTEKTSLRFGSYNAKNLDSLNNNRASIGLTRIDSTMSNLEGTWYNQVSFYEMKEAYRNCSTCETLSDYFKLSGAIRSRVRGEYKNTELESFLFNFNPDDIREFEMFGSTQFMPKLQK